MHKRPNFPQLTKVLRTLTRDQRATLLLRIAKLWGECAVVTRRKNGNRIIVVNRQPLRCHEEG